MFILLLLLLLLALFNIKGLQFNKFLSFNQRNKNVILKRSDADSRLIVWEKIKVENVEKNDVKIRIISNDLYLTSDEFGSLSIESNLDDDNDQDFQFWLIDSNNNLIRNKKTKMYLTVDFDETVITLKDRNEKFNKWKLLPLNQSFESSD